MVSKKPFKSSGRVAANAKPPKRRHPLSGGLVIPEDEKRHLVAAAAYFRAARYRNIGADGYRKADECDAAIELEAMLKRHSVHQ